MPEISRIHLANLLSKLLQVDPRMWKSFLCWQREAAATSRFFKSLRKKKEEQEENNLLI